VDVDRLCINTLRFLAVDAVEQAQSGHPGLPLGAAPIAYVLWDRFLRHNPADPQWFDRDRFVLSAGHGSALLYALLHTTGYDLPLREISNFRQWGSRTPGHPEHGLAPGVEATTGPLGQGFGMAVGMAAAERFLSGRYNRPGMEVIDHYTYVLASDGDMMEGVSHEAASLAGTLGLGKLVCLYDDNDISIEGDTDMVFLEDVGARFEAYGWQVQHVEDANDLDALDKAITGARAETGRPSLIIARSHLGFGSPKQDDAEAHGAPLGAEAVKATREKLGWPEDRPFFVPEQALDHFRKARRRGREQQDDWRRRLSEYRKADPGLADDLDRALRGMLPEGWEDRIPSFKPDQGPMATRAASGKVLNALAPHIPNLIGGSADLAPSNKTLLEGFDDFSSRRPGRNLRFGVREFAMAAIMNGMALHGGIIPYGGTFLVFSDYARPAIRLAAMMGTAVIYVFTHDSIALGEDGPTHQPVEHLMSLRAIPGLTVMRPADANETAECWKTALAMRKPVALALSRQKLPVIDPDRYPVVRGTSRGGYVLSPADGPPEVCLIATGSEVHPALEAQEMLAGQGKKAAVVSMPSWEVFEGQPEAYRMEVLPPEVPRLAVEAGATLGWHKYTGRQGDILGLDRFGASAPGPVAYEKLGFTAAEIVRRCTRLTGG
jgi:transketolase